MSRTEHDSNTGKGESLKENSFLPLVIRVQNEHNILSTFKHTTGRNVQLYDVYCYESLGEWLGKYRTSCDDTHTYVH